MATSDDVGRARAAIGERAWALAATAYRGCTDLAASDLEAWGLAEFLSGHDLESDSVRERAHQAYVRAGDQHGAARVAFWLGLSLVLRGDRAQGQGWFGRMRSAAGEGFEASVWSGYDALNQGMAALFAGDLDTSLVKLGDALSIADRHDDIDLRLLAGSGHGQALLALGRTADGMAELDEVMVLATSSAASPQVVGRVYCAVIEVCRGCLDLARSAEWTEVLGRWCDAQPELVPFRGQCLVHRSEVLQTRGRWDDAASEVEKMLARVGTNAVEVARGMAMYQRAELQRLRGDFPGAERSYRDALAAGHDPQPGLALLRLAQGRAGSASVSLRRALDESPVVFARVRLLPAVVEVAVASGDRATADAASAELSEIAERLDSAYVRAVAASAEGACALAAGDGRQALGSLRSAMAAWAGLDAPYDAARCRVLLSRACAALGDLETADLELASARRTFAELGAHQDLAALDGAPQRRAPAGLTPREVEVLGLVASGSSNRQIAERLVLSERTVARHVANIFLKIDVSTRSAATAYAYEQRLV